MGGIEAGNTIAIYISEFLHLLALDKTDYDIKIEIMKMFSSSICDNEIVNETLINNKSISLFLDIIKQGDKLSKWICYTILLMIRDNDDLIFSLPNYPNFFEKINYVESLNWEGWQFNMASILLQVEGYKKLII